MGETIEQRIYDRCIIRVGQLEAENEKLRELVRELANDPDAWDYDYFKRRLRELGVEV